MSEQNWVLKGVDPETRQHAVEEAERRGMSLADYLSDVVLQAAVLEQLAQTPAAAPGANTLGAPENFAVRHRLEALERRLGISVGGLDAALHAVDSTVFGLAARMDETEMVAADTADGLARALQEIGGTLAAMRKRVGDAEDGLGALSDNHELARADAHQMGGRVDHLEITAHDTNSALRALGQAQEALKYAVADDFRDFTRDTIAQLNSGLDEARAAADAATEQADAAAAHLLNEMRGLRDALEERLADSLDDTRERVQAAFGATADRLSSLAERVIENERQTQRVTDQLRAQIVDVEDGAYTALEHAAEQLRQADTETHAALETAQGRMLGEIADLRAQHAEALARLKLVDATAASTISDLGDLRTALERRLEQAERNADQRFSQAQSSWTQQIDSLNSRLTAQADRAEEAEHRLRADTERVEACTIAALEKIVGDISSVDAALTQRIDADVNDLREHQAGALARLKLLEATLGSQDRNAEALAARVVALEAGDAERPRDVEFTERLTRLEAAALNTTTQDAVDSLRQDVTGLLSAQPHLDDMRARIAAAETGAVETADRVQGLARMIGRVSAQSADAAAQAQEGQHKLELMLADMRLEHLSKQNEPSAHAAEDMIAALNQRVMRIEDRQAAALEALRADIALFVEQNDARLAALERQPAATIDYDVAGEFEQLRQRIEDRIMGVEHRSVRALEQVAETVAVIEKRLSGENREVRSA
ncbi:MAG: hypothetical protein J0L81_09930 [Caulobacterales bacterium]|nr:hypothetical protein [Caulobacterales bacterium]